jgi:peptide/nickel transport system permease protein
MQRLATMLLQLIVVMFGILSGLFFLLRLSGDPAQVLAGPDATPETVAQIRQQLGLDEPLVVQYFSFLGQTARLDFGRSFRYRQPALSMVLQRLPTTLQLAAAAVGVAVLVAVPLGVLAAVRRGRPESRLIMLLAALGQAMPSFWLGIVLILVFAVQLRWLPSFGSGDLQHMILPVATLAAFQVARLARLVRSEMLEVLSQDYIRTAYAKGLSARLVLWRHALRNVLVTLVTAAGLDFSILLGGAVVVETVFTYNGLGLQLVESIGGRDYPVVQATVFVVAIVVVLVHFLVDWTYPLLDPRTRGRAA